MRIVLIGVPGAGKSTQGNLLSKQLSIPYLSAGHIFRMLAKEKSPMGRLIKETLHSGNLLPDEKTIPVIEKYLEKPAYKNGYIIDGFPRTLSQAQYFNPNVDKVVYITLPDKEALWRIAYRTEDRDDSAAKTIIHRINVFHENTDKVIDFYQTEGKLVEVDGQPSIEEVNEEILKGLGKEDVEGHVKKWEQKKNIVLLFTGLDDNTVKKVMDYVSSEHNVPQTDSLEGDTLKNKFNESTKLVLGRVTNPKEYTQLQKALPEAKIVLVGVIDEERSHLHSKASDEELDQRGAVLVRADYIISAQSDEELLNYKAEHIYRDIYYDLED